MPALRILITGASKGIGWATAKRLAKQGHKLGLFDVQSQELKHLVKQDKSFKNIQSTHVITGHMDVTLTEDWDNTISQMYEKFGGIDVLINNAGILVTGKLPQTNLQSQLKLVDINCKGVLIGCHKLAKLMQSDAHPSFAKIINLSSASAIYGQSEIAPYSASKFFVRGLTEALNIEFKSQPKVIDVMPLWVKTDMTKGKSVTSMDRLGVRLSAEDVAKALCKLTTATNKSLTKTHYPVGIPARLFGAIAQVSPNRLVRWVNQKVGT